MQENTTPMYIQSGLEVYQVFSIPINNLCVPLAPREGTNPISRGRTNPHGRVVEL